MNLPSMKFADGYTKVQQVRFGGYNHTRGAGDGELWEMENLSSGAYPYLTTRPRRGRVATIANPGGIGAHNCLFWVEGTNFMYQNTAVGQVTAGEKMFAVMGNRILIFPDKALYHTGTGLFESLEASVSASAVTFAGGTLYGEEADCNTVRCATLNFNSYFSPGDAIQISGCTVHPENNKTPIIREISEDGHEMHFSEFAFTLDEQDDLNEEESITDETTTAKPKDYTEPGTLQFARTVPDMDFICVNENRLWGCKGDTIYCSKLGDPKNFNVFDGLDTDSFSVDAGSAGDFTACCAYRSYPCFFKERFIYKMYGDLPSNFQLIGGPDLGVKTGAMESLAIADNNLFYLSTAGVMAYAGGIPSPVGGALGDSFSHAVGGSDGMKYYVSMVRTEDGTRSLFVYDTQQGLWHREDDINAMGFACLSDTLYLLEQTENGGVLWDLSGQSGEREETLPWMVEFADFTENSPDVKGYSKLQLRIELEEDSSAVVELRFDSLGTWQSVGTLQAGLKRTCLLPIVPQRADHYRLRIRGTGDAVLFALTRQYYGGSELKAVWEAKEEE